MRAGGVGRRKRVERRELMRLRKGKPAREAGFFVKGENAEVMGGRVFVIRDRVGQRRRGTVAAVAGEKRKTTGSAAWKFHGARPLGASGPSRVRGPRQWGQVSGGGCWEVNRVAATALLGLSVVGESSSLACWSS